MKALWKSNPWKLVALALAGALVGLILLATGVFAGRQYYSHHKTQDQTLIDLKQQIANQDKTIGELRTGLQSVVGYLNSNISNGKLPK